MVAASTSQLEEERNAALTQHKAVHVQVGGREVTNNHCRGIGLHPTQPILSLYEKLTYLCTFPPQPLHQPTPSRTEPDLC